MDVSLSVCDPHSYFVYFIIAVLYVYLNIDAELIVINHFKISKGVCHEIYIPLLLTIGLAS